MDIEDNTIYMDFKYDNGNVMLEDWYDDIEAMM